MSIRTGLIQINVTDPGKSLGFYTDVLGFEVERRIGDSELPLLRNPGGPSILLYPVTGRRTPDYPNETGPTLVFAVENIDETYREWKEKGVRFRPAAWADEETGIAGCPFGRFIAFEDPDGNVHEVIEMKE